MAYKEHADAEQVGFVACRVSQHSKGLWTGTDITFTNVLLGYISIFG